MPSPNSRRSRRRREETDGARYAQAALEYDFPGVFVSNEDIPRHVVDIVALDMKRRRIDDAKKQGKAAVDPEKFVLSHKLQSVRGHLRTGLEADVSCSSESDQTDTDSEYESAESEMDVSKSTALTPQRKGAGEVETTPSSRLRSGRKVNFVEEQEPEQKSSPHGSENKENSRNANAENENDPNTLLPLASKKLFGFTNVRLKHAVSITTPSKEVSGGKDKETPSKRSIRSDSAKVTPSRRLSRLKNDVEVTPLTRFAALPTKTATLRAADTPRTRSLRRRNMITNAVHRLGDDHSSSDSDVCLEFDDEASDETSCDEEQEQANIKGSAHRDETAHLKQLSFEVQDVEDEEAGLEKEQRLKDVGTSSFHDLFQQLHDARNAKTSDNNLKKLPKLDQNKLEEILLNMKVKHPSEKEALLQNYRKHFSSWICEIQYGFNLLFYGYGSKRDILLEFARTRLSNHYTLVLNGYFPSLNYRAALSSVITDVIHQSGSQSQGTMYDQTRTIKNYFDSEKGKSHLYIVVHNLDGSSFRQERIQASLAFLASASRVHIIASVDHVNAMLLFDTAKASLFNFVYHDLTTFQPYIQETTYENVGSITHGAIEGEGVCSSGITRMLYVLRSLSSKNKELFSLLAQHQIRETAGDDDLDLESDEEGSAQPKTVAKDQPSFESVGMTFRAFYSLCKSKFTASTEQTFKSQLGEYLDHELIVCKRYKHSDVYFIPLTASELREVLEKM